MAELPSAPRARRADAELNRGRILDAARAALDASGDATMQSIARAAGIGQGTLYRHFPTREALIMAVHRNDVAELVGVVPDLLARHPPLRALRLWLDQLAVYGRIKHGLGSALHAAGYAELRDEGYGPVLGAIAALLEAGEHSGELRAGVGADDVLILVGFLWRIDPNADDWGKRTSHLLDLVIDGLRPPA